MYNFLVVEQFKHYQLINIINQLHINRSNIIIVTNVVLKSYYIILKKKKHRNGFFFFFKHFTRINYENIN